MRNQERWSWRLDTASITTPGAPPENRMETIATFHCPLKAGFLVSDMNRADLDWKNGSFTWRYENKLTVERAFRSAPITSSRILPPSHITRASTRNGAPRHFMQVAGSPQASTSYSIPTMSTKTTPARVRISSRIISGWLYIFTSLW